MSDKDTNQKIKPFIKRDGVLGPFISGIFVIIVIILILLNEIYWVNGAPGNIMDLNKDLFFVLMPGLIIISSLFTLAFSRSRSYVRSFQEISTKSEKDVKIEKI